jgi:hypothetical protein
MHIKWLFNLALAFAIVTGVPCRSQTSDAVLVGHVTDPSSAGIPNSEVEVVNAATGIRRAVQSDAHGHYRVDGLQPGEYTLQVDAAGFRKTTVSMLQLQAGATATANVQMQLQAQTTQIDVEAAGVLIDTVTPNARSTFGSAQLSTLPISGAATTGILNVGLLAPGVASNGGLGVGIGAAVAGQRPTSNNFTIEGVDVNSRAASGPVVIMSNEAVSEVSFQQNSLTADLGHSSGGHFNTIVMSGSNSNHGSLYEYFQNRNLNAVDESFKRVRVATLPRFDQNRFGGTAGGAIQKDKWFYFGAVERQLQGRAAANAGVAYGPTTDGLRMLESVPGVSSRNLDVIKSHVGPASVRSHDAIVAGRAIPVGRLNTIGPSFTNDWRFVGSSDYSLSDRSQLRGRWISQRSNSVDNFAVLPAFYSPVETRVNVASLAHIYTFSSNLTNEFRGGFTRHVDHRPAGNQTIPGLDSFPNFTFTDISLSLGFHPSYPQANRSSVFQVSDSLTWITGRHTWSFGYDGRKNNSSFFFVPYQRGDYTYRSLEQFLTDITPDAALRSVGAYSFIGNQLSHYTYANDVIRLTRNLVWTLGLRYEYVEPPTGAKQQSLNSLANVPGVLEFNAPTPSHVFAPRMGLVYSPGSSGRTALRAGWGMTYDQIQHNLWMNTVPPQFSTMVLGHIDRAGQTGFLASGGILPHAVPITDAASARARTTSWIPELQRPYAMQWNAGLQQRVAQDYVLDIRYLGTRGVRLPVQMQINRGAAVGANSPGILTYLARPSQAQLDALTLSADQLRGSNTLAAAGFANTITSYQTRGNSIYHGLATSLSRQYGNGLQWTFAHTWSHNIDDSTPLVSSTLLTPRRPQDFFDLRSERADSMLDRRHRLTTAWLYTLPGVCGNKAACAVLRDWSLSGTFMAETGAWATVRSGIDSNGNGDAIADRTVINPKGDASRSSVVTPLLNSAGKTVAYLAADPTARYIQAGNGVAPNGSRNTLRLPGIMNVDLAAAKTITLREGVSLQFRAEAYNAFNHAQYVPGFVSAADLRPRVSAASNSMLVVGNPIFNRPDLAFESNSRTMQLVLKLSF